MLRSIKITKLGVYARRGMLVLLIVISLFTLVACNKKNEQVTTQEFELVSCYIEYKNVTNGFGGIVRTDEYLHYGYIDANSKVIFDEMSFGSWINFEITEETPKFIVVAENGSKDYTFQLTREMYKNINSSQN